MASSSRVRGPVKTRGPIQIGSWGPVRKGHVPRAPGCCVAIRDWIYLPAPTCLLFPSNTPFRSKFKSHVLRTTFQVLDELNCCAIALLSVHSAVFPASVPTEQCIPPTRSPIWLLTVPHLECAYTPAWCLNPRLRKPVGSAAPRWPSEQVACVALGRASRCSAVVLSVSAAATVCAALTLPLGTDVPVKHQEPRFFLPVTDQFESRCLPGSPSGP